MQQLDLTESVQTLLQAQKELQSTVDHMLILLIQNVLKRRDNRTYKWKPVSVLTEEEKHALFVLLPPKVDNFTCFPCQTEGSCLQGDAQARECFKHYCITLARLTKREAFRRQFPFTKQQLRARPRNDLTSIASLIGVHIFSLDDASKKGIIRAILLAQKGLL